MAKPASADHVGSLNRFRLERRRSEGMRWSMLVQIEDLRPAPVNDMALLSLIQAIWQDATRIELQRELDYLAERSLIKVKDVEGLWSVKLTFEGIDVVQYTTACPPGIARPMNPE